MDIEPSNKSLDRILLVVLVGLVAIVVLDGTHSFEGVFLMIILFFVMIAVLAAGLFKSVVSYTKTKDNKTLIYLLVFVALCAGVYFFK